MSAVTHDPDLTCSAFLDAFSEYREGTLRDPALRAAVETHLGECLRCRRLAQAMTRGLALLQHAVPDLEPSAGFQARLRERLKAQISVGDPVTPTHAGVAAALLVVTALGLLLSEGLGRDDAPAPPVAAAAAPGFEPALSNLTLPAFGHSTLEFHGVHAPLGSYALFGP
jgi:predicted anti-sigma-YlaC factor YlaD